MIVVKAFIRRDFVRNICTTWQCLYWIMLFSAITVELKRLLSLLSFKEVDVLRVRVW